MSSSLYVSNLPPFAPSYLKIFCLVPCFETPLISVIAFMWEIKFHVHTKQEVKFRFKISTAMMMHIVAFLVMTRCSFVGGYECS
jgi:hypothetical protein